MIKSVSFALLGFACQTQAAQNLIFNEEFNTLDFKTWQHELTLSGEGNWEFEQYVNDRRNTFVKDGILYIKPTLATQYYDTDTIEHGTISIWGGSPADLCTSNNFWGCARTAQYPNVNNPVLSGRIRTVNSFSFMYGKVEISAKMPKGDWLWPAMWFLPTHNEYGNWPLSGEIDLVESKGNPVTCDTGGSNQFGSTLHLGPDWRHDNWAPFHGEYTQKESLADKFYVYGLYWDEHQLYTYIRDPDSNEPEKKVLQLNFDEMSNFKRGGWNPEKFYNPWEGEPNNAPFNKEYYIILNVAVGGTNSYFPDGHCGKPWRNTDQDAAGNFWRAKQQWYPTWNGNDAALQVDWIKVWSVESESETVEE